MLISIAKRILSMSGFKRRLSNYINYLAEEKMKNNFKKLYYEKEWENNLRTGVEYIDVKVLDKNKIRCYTNSLMGEWIFKESFEKEEIDFLKRFLRKGDLCIDIGANIGLFSVIAAGIVGETGSVYAFEPDPNTFRLLIENIEINSLKNITAIQEGISNEKSTLQFHSYKDGMGVFNSFAPTLKDKPFDVFDVNTNTLDDFLQATGIEIVKIRLIKIDVEGWELPVLMGAAKLLSSPNAPALLVEFTEENARSAGSTCQELFDLGVSYGYTWHNITECGLKKAEKKEYYPYQNLVAIK